MTGACAAACVAGAATAFSATAEPSEVTAYGSSGAAANLTTSSTVAAPTGGTGTITYSWAQYGQSPYTWVIGAPAAANTAFTVNSLPAGTVAAATFICTMTDSTGAKAQATVYASANNGQPYSPPGGGDPPVPPGGSPP
jgi:hypothetical protein